MIASSSFVDVVLIRFRDRFLSKIVAGPGGCHIWVGARNRKGYGVVRVSGRAFLAHRVAHELFRGEIPDGFHIDHLCRNPSCVNIAHLEAVTPGENTRRGNNFQRDKTHCPQGHPYSGANLMLRPEGRRCRICTCTANRVYKTRIRSAVPA